MWCVIVIASSSSAGVMFLVSLGALGLESSLRTGFMFVSAKTFREPPGRDYLCCSLMAFYIFRIVVILPGDSISICDFR